MQAFFDLVITFVTTAGVRLIIGIALLLIGWKLITKLTERVIKTHKIQTIDRTAQVFISHFINIGLKLLLVIVCISILGVNMTSVVALLTTAAAAIGLALQGGLSNIAGGIIILIFKPFKLGDFLICNGNEGCVTDINLFYTVIKTYDNKIVNIPNATVSNSATVNLSQEEFRRVEIDMTVDFDANIEGIQALLKQIAASNELVVSEPAPDAPIMGYGENGINLRLRAWTKNSDYWTVFFALNDSVRVGFETYDVKFALPKMEVRQDKK